MRAEIEIGNSVCRVLGVPPNVFAALREATSYRKKTGRRVKTKSGKMIPEIRTMFLMDRRGVFPTGLLYVVEEFMAAKRVAYSVRDTRAEPELLQRRLECKRDFPPYPEQSAAAVAALQHGRGIVVGPTGVGKSAIAREIVAAFGVKSLIVVPSLELKKQLTESLRAAFGEDTVGPLKKDKTPQFFISVENVDSLDPGKPITGVDLLIIDEFHHSAAQTYRDLNRKAWSGIYFKIGLTATPFRANEDERLLLESVLSKVIYRITYEQAVSKGYIVPMEAYYVDLPEMELKGPATTYASVYKQLVVEREDRNLIIARMVENLREQGISTLVLTKQIDHGKRLQEMTGEVVPFAEGKNEFNRELIQLFNQRKLHALIGTVGVIGEGVDTKPCEYVILAGGGKSKNQFMQNVGRGFRKFTGKESCKIIMIRDSSHKWTLTHFEECVSYLKREFGVIPVKLELDL